jgi:hypothetical protein
MEEAADLEAPAPEPADLDDQAVPAWPVQGAPVTVPPAAEAVAVAVEEPQETEAAPAVDSPPVVVAEPASDPTADQEPPHPGAAPAPPGIPLAPGAFASPLFAGIGPDAADAHDAPGYRSTLLAEIADAPGATEYSGSILSGLLVDEAGNEAASDADQGPAQQVTDARPTGQRNVAPPVEDDEDAARRDETDVPVAVADQNSR